MEGKEKEKEKEKKKRKELNESLFIPCKLNNSINTFDFIINSYFTYEKYYNSNILNFNDLENFTKKRKELFNIDNDIIRLINEYNWNLITDNEFKLEIKKLNGETIDIFSPPDKEYKIELLLDEEYDKFMDLKFKKIKLLLDKNEIDLIADNSKMNWIKKYCIYYIFKKMMGYELCFIPSSIKC
jgi:hypothetical protein